MAQLQCLVVTPGETLREGPADFVALTLYDGEIGIAPGHAPMIGRVGYGEMRIQTAGRNERYYVEGGFVEVLNDVVSVLTNRALAADKVNAAAAQEQLIEAQQRKATTPETMAIRDRLIAQSQAQLRVARRAAEVPLSSAH